MPIRFKDGNIYSHGGEILAVEVEGRGPLRKKLRSLPGLRLKQDGDNVQASTFHDDDFDSVAALVKPRRRRQMSDVQREMINALLDQFYTTLLDELLKDDEILKYLTKNELKSICNLENRLKNIDVPFKRLGLIE